MFDYFLNRVYYVHNTVPEVQSMSTYNATNARKQFFSLLQQINEHHDVLTITGKHGNVVMLSEKDWEDISETLQLTTIPGMSQSIKNGLNTPIDECSDHPGW